MLTARPYARSLRNGTRAWDPFGELQQLQDEVTRLFHRDARRYMGPTDYPPLNVHNNEEEALVTAELPGWSPDNIELSVVQNTLTVRGTAPTEEQGQEISYHRRERRSGHFVRTLELPFAIDAEGVQAEFRAGILSIKLPRAAEHKPKRIEVKGS